MRDTRLRDSLSDLAPRLFRKVSRRHQKALQPFGISTVQAHILAVLWLEGPMLVGELQRLLDLGSSTLSGALDRMEKAELLRREPVAEDRRAFRVVPARWPEARKRQVLEALAATDDELCAPLTEKERRTLLTLLGKLLAAEERRG